MRASSALVGCLGLGVIFATSTAAAHFELKSPAPSHPEEKSGKGGFPCGPDDSSTVITNVMGGSQIAITVDENVFHPGHYRVALSLNKSNADIAIARMMELPKDPVVRGANNMVLKPEGPGTSVSADTMDPPVFPVLADNLFAHTTNMKNFSQMITLPNVTCERCTLQVIEFMAEHGADYYYRHCADLKITADPGKPIFDPGGMGGTGGTGGTGGAGGGTGGTAGGTGGASTAGAGGVANGGGGGTGPSGGTPNGGGSVGTGGTSSTGGTGTGGTGVSSGGTGVGGTGAVPPATPTEDDGGCSLSAAGKHSTRLLGSGAALLLGLGLLGRRRNRAR